MNAADFAGQMLPGAPASPRYDRWLETLDFQRPAGRAAFYDHPDVIRGGEWRIETALYECARESRHAGLTRALQALRGGGEFTVIPIVTEVGDFRRFATAPHLIAYAGLVHPDGGVHGRDLAGAPAELLSHRPGETDDLE